MKHFYLIVVNTMAVVPLGEHESFDSADDKAMGLPVYNESPTWIADEELLRSLVYNSQNALGMKKKWRVQIHGRANSPDFEISVVNTAKIGKHQEQYGWFDKNKLLITHNGGPCNWSLTEKVWEKQVRVAKEVAEELNSEVDNLD